MRGSIAAALGLSIASLAVLAGADPARAGCNTIPPASLTFGSTTGSVDRALAVPGAKVTLTLHPECAGSVRDHFESGDRVTVVFQSADPALALEATVPANKVDVLMPSQLVFEMPYFAADYPPYGVAGPATILVRDSQNGVIAQIDELHQPSKCGVEPEKVFQHFTVLPKANSFEDKVTKDDYLLMTLDKRGNLLIPFQHEPVPTSDKGPAAHVQQGVGEFPARSSNATLAIKAALVQAKLDGKKDNEIVQAFTPEGFPLPPVVGIDAEGALFGTVDAGFSVLRVAHHGTYFDLGDQTTGVDKNGVTYPGIGPIVMRHAGNDKKFKVQRCAHPTLLANMRASKELTVLVTDEALVKNQNGDGDETDAIAEILARANSKNCVVNTKTAVAFDGTRPLVDAAGHLAAVVRDDGVLRAFRSNGLPSAAGLTPAVNRSPAFNGNTAVAVASDGHVFFRDATSANGTALKLLATAGQGAVIDAAIDTVGTEVDRDAGTAIVRAVTGPAWFYDLDFGGALSMTVPADQVAIVDHMVAMLVPEASTDGLGNNDADDTDSTVVFARVSPPLEPTLQPLGIAADTVRLTTNGARTWIVFRTPESAEGPAGEGCKAVANGCDLTDDGDTTDLVLRTWDVASKALTTIEVAEDFVAAGDLVAYRTPGANGKLVLKVYDLSNAAIVPTGRVAEKAIDTGYEWMRPYGIRDRTVYFVSRDAAGKRELVTFQVDSLAFQSVTTVEADAALPPAVAVTIAGAPMLGLQTKDGEPMTLFGDRDGDGVFDSYDRCIDVADRSSYDDDLDGLATACDPDLCTPFRIPAVMRTVEEHERATAQSIVDAGVKYLGARLRASTDCLTRLAVSDPSATARSEATLRCRGYVVDGVEVAPTDATAAAAVAEARKLFLLVWQPTHATQQPDRDAIVGGFTEAAIAISHAAFGDDASPAGSPCAEALARSAHADLDRVLETVTAFAASLPTTDTVVKRPGDALTLPSAPSLPAPAPVAGCTATALAPLDACANDPAGVARCVRCVALRRAVDAVFRVYGVAGGQPVR